MLKLITWYVKLLCVYIVPNFINMYAWFSRKGTIRCISKFSLICLACYHQLHSPRVLLLESPDTGPQISVLALCIVSLLFLQVDSTVVHVDHTGPQVSVLGLQGRLGRHGLYVHNSTDLSAMRLAVNVSDEHSGIYTIWVSVGTRYLSDDVAHSAVGVQRLDNVVSWLTLPVSLLCVAIRSIVTPTHMFRYIRMHTLIHTPLLPTTTPTHSY